MAKSKKKQKGKKGRGTTIKLVVKSNELVEARYMFDVWETRFFHSLIASIKKDDDDEKIYRLWFKDMKETFQLKSNQSYDFLREAAMSMASKSVYIGWQNDKFRRGKLHRIIRFVDFLEKGQSGPGVKGQEYVDVSIDKDIRPYLLDIKKNFNPKISRYTSYDLRNIIKLKPYAARIYELFKQMEYKGYRTIIVNDLKDMFEMTDEYPRFSNFYQKVILASVKAINKYTDITVPEDRIEKMKKGRSVYALRFQILGKGQEEMNIILGEIAPKTLFSDLEKIEEIEVEEENTLADSLFDEFEKTVIQGFGVTPSVFLKMLNSGKYDEAAIEQAIAVTRRAKYNQEIKKSVAGFFLRALKDGYTDAKIEAGKLATQKRLAIEKVETLKKDLILLKDEYAKAINQRIRDITNENEEVTNKAIAAILNNPVTEAMVRMKESALGRSLEVEDYRQDEALRGMVINNIIQLQGEFFEDLTELYQPKVKQLEIKVQQLSKGVKF
jgi:plasmid replication initiation protein